jgi:hypothetical protein
MGTFSTCVGRCLRPHTGIDANLYQIFIHLFLWTTLCVSNHLPLSTFFLYKGHLTLTVNSLFHHHDMCGPSFLFVRFVSYPKSQITFPSKPVILTLEFHSSLSIISQLTHISYLQKPFQNKANYASFFAYVVAWLTTIIHGKNTHTHKNSIKRVAKRTIESPRNAKVSCTL